jgi:transcriptional regulator with XRE-family HTH domain
VPDVEDIGIDVFYRHVGAQVRSARIAAGVSQAAVAARVGLTRSSVANLEAGRQHISLYHFSLITRALNAEFGDLLPTHSAQPNANILTDLCDELADSPDTAKEFVRGAIAQLRAVDNAGRR